MNSRNRPWLETEIKILLGMSSDSEAAFALQRSVESVRMKRRQLESDGKKPAKAAKVKEETTVEEDKEKSSNEVWKRRFQDLEKKYKDVLEHNTDLAELTSLAKEIAPSSYDPAPALYQTRSKSPGKPQSAVLMLSDTHVGQVIQPDQTLGFGDYNADVFRARLKFYEEAVTSILRDHTNTTVPELVVCLGGDMLHGNLNHAAEVGQHVTLFEQFFIAAHAISQFLRNLSSLVPKIRIYTTVGNHCVDTETEIFTQRGWLRCDEVTTTDYCLGLEMDGKSHWQPIKSVVIEDRIDDVVTLRNRQFDFRGTIHHRFYFRPTGMTKLFEARWSEIRGFGKSIEIPVSGEGAGNGDGVPDKYLELCAAVLTDGCVSVKNGITVYQSPKKESWVREAFEKSSLTYTRRHRTRKSPPHICGRPWKGGETTEEVSYHLSASAGREFLAVTGLKKGSFPDWIWNLTRDQFNRFFHALLMGDGTGVDTSSPTLYGKSKEWLGIVQGLCALHGWKGILSEYCPNNTNPNIQYRLSLNKESFVSIDQQAEEKYESDTVEKVWCVTTDTENFFCRRNGRSYFTGNTRWGTQHKMPTENRYSNLDQFLYAHVEALTKDVGMEWHIDKQPVALFDVQGFKFHLSHGDELRGGDRALGIPNHAVGRLVSSKSQLFGKDGRPAPHYYLVGHLHRGIVLPHARGSFIVNGGFPGVDGYGLAAGFSPVDPKQVFFLVHPKYGKTATYEIELKFAKTDAPNYDIPTLGGAV